jgi:DNA invertase Pin-like site-specific DNA recombinase
MRVALYLRVSTDDQTNEPQRIELLEYCRRQGWTDIREYTDKMSGAKWSRIGLSTMMADIRKHAIDAVLCVKLDRLGRSLAHLAQIFGELEQHKCALVIPSQAIDTTKDNPASIMTRGMLAVIAEFERGLIRERTKAGLAAARARGSVLGRPRMKLTDAEREVIASHKGTVKELAEKLGCSMGKAHALRKGAQ